VATDPAQPDGLPVVPFESQDDFSGWLSAQDGSAGLWVKIAKQGAPEQTISYDQALDVALCHGWIDGQKRSMDEYFWLQRFTPRRARSKWSRRNCTKAEALIEEGRMHAAGLREVEAAKADGRWDAAYPGQASAAVPPDLQGALDEQPEAAAFFASLDRSNRFAILYRIHEAKRPETRQRRIATFVAMLSAGETLHPTPVRASAKAKGDERPSSVE
jgi:uncharacterized protein YdeI (YjbR/CyaY-like superfamily)